MLKSIEDFQAEEIQGIAELIVAEARNGAIKHSIVGGMAFVLVSILTLIITRGIYKLFGNEPEVLEDLAHKIASGDLGLKFETKNIALTRAFAAMKNMTEKLCRVVIDIKTASEDVANGNGKHALKRKAKIFTSVKDRFAVTAGSQGIESVAGSWKSKNIALQID